MILGAMGVSLVSMVIFGVGISLASGFVYALGGIAVALTYARLREIKEGVNVEKIVAVFD